MKNLRNEPHISNIIRFYTITYQNEVYPLSQGITILNHYSFDNRNNLDYVRMYFLATIAINEAQKNEPQIASMVARYLPKPGLGTIPP